MNRSKNLGKYATKGATPWNKGLTKKDPRVMKYVKKWKKWMAKNPQRFWLGKKRPDISGDKHWQYGKSPKEETKKKMSAIKQGVTLEEWKGFTSSKDRADRLRFRYQIQKKVFERDDYTCQLCGVKGNQLQVDHIQPWSEYIALRFNIENCRTLCMSCHYQITFGKPMPPTVRAWGHNFSKGGKQL